VSYHPAKAWARRQGLSEEQSRTLGKSEAVIAKAVSPR